MLNDEPEKKKRLRLGPTQCVEYARSDAGLQALKSPLQVMLRSPRNKRTRLHSMDTTADGVPQGSLSTSSGRIRPNRLNSSKLSVGVSGLDGMNTFMTASELVRATQGSLRASDLDQVRTVGRLQKVKDYTEFKGIAEERMNKPLLPLEGLDFHKRAQEFCQFYLNRARKIGDRLQPEKEFSASKYSGSPSGKHTQMGNTDGFSTIPFNAESPKRTFLRGVRKNKPQPQSNTLFNYYKVKGDASTQTNSSPIGQSSGDSTDSIPNLPETQMVGGPTSGPCSKPASHPPHVRKLFSSDDDQFDNFLDQFDAFMSQASGQELTDSSQSTPESSVVFLKELNSKHLPDTQQLIEISDSSEPESQEIVPSSSQNQRVTERNLEEITYGLFGSKGNDSPLTDDDNEAGDTVSFAILPTHVVEMILCRLPLPDLLLNYSRVAKEWNAIISNHSFIPWKKKYHKLKTGVETSVLEMRRMTSLSGMDVLQTCLLGLIHFMSRFNLVPPRDGISRLQRHAKYTGAEALLRDKAPKCLVNPCWPIVAALVILSETFWDVYNILKHLVSGSCPVVDALESLYCIASFLLHFKREYNAGYGLHYRVYYALYVFENQWTARIEDLSAVRENLSGQQNIMRYGSGESKVRLTHEQMRIVNHVLRPNHLVKIVAFAGSGKTSTLVEYTTLRLGTKFLLVVYNKAVAEHAKKVFLGNVECRTSHSLAWGAFGARFKSKLTTKLRPFDIMDYLMKAPNHYGRKQQYARCVINAMENFMASADPFITTAHVPTEVRTQDEMVTRNLSDEERLDIADDAETIWKKMINPRDFQVRAVHDCYLKLYQLSKPVLIYDCVLIDEAQDCNPAILDVLLNQTCPKIVVGDPNQQIYAFRGAVDALDRVEATHVFYLTQSFRFGPEIAYVSSLALEVLKGKDGKTLVGGTQRSRVTGSHEGQVAILARSNVTLFNEAVRLVCKNGPSRSYDPEQVCGAFAGGIQGYGLDQLVDIYNLLENTGQNIRDRFISRFKSFSALLQYAKNTDDAELLGKIQLVKQHTHRIPGYVSTIKSRCGTPLAMANVVFSTVHKAKGLEFDTVCLMDDFTIGQFPYNVARPTSELQSEYNVLYVAITRAKKCLCMPATVYFMLLGAQEKFEYPVSVIGDGLLLKCVKCQTDFGPSGSHVMMQRRLHLVDRLAVAEGPLCDTCSDQDVFVPAIRHPYLGIFFGDAALDDRSRKLFKWIVTKNV